MPIQPMLLLVRRHFRFLPRRFAARLVATDGRALQALRSRAQADAYDRGTGQVPVDCHVRSSARSMKRSSPITDGCLLAVPREQSGVAMEATRALIRRQASTQCEKTASAWRCRPRPCRPTC